MNSWEYYLRNPHISDRAIKLFIKNDCKVGTSVDGWEIVERSDDDKNDYSDDDPMYVDFLIKDLLNREIEEINTTPLTKTGDVYKNCLCYYKWEVKNNILT